MNIFTESNIYDCIGIKPTPVKKKSHDNELNKLVYVQRQYIEPFMNHVQLQKTQKVDFKLG